MKKLLHKLALATLFLMLLASSVGLYPSRAEASTCTYTGQCTENRKTCYCIYGSCHETQAPCGSAIIGEVEAPQGVAEFNEAASGEIGFFKFISRIINFASIVGGILVMFNFLSAGFIYIFSAGDAGAHTQVRDKITWGLIGLAIIASIYMIAAVIGVLFYGSSAAVLNPNLGGALN